MKTANIVKAVCVAGLAASCFWGLAGCTSGDGSTGGNGDKSTSASTGLVAATVNGTEISEDKVTDTIENARAQMSLTDEDSWGKWLAENAMTPQSVREEIINAFIDEEIIKQTSSERNVTVEDSEVDTVVNNTKSQYDSDEKWLSALEKAGMTEDDYRTKVREDLQRKKFQESFIPTEDPTQEEMLEQAKMYATAYDGAKRSSHILFEEADEETAKTVLEQVRSGELDFAEAAKQYSKDTGSAEKGGDVGWDKLSSFVTEYTDALSNLEKDQISDLVKSQYGFHIIKCTDVFQAPKTTGDDGAETVEVTSIDQLPAEFVEKVKETLKQKKQSEDYQNWMTERREGEGVKINDMPEGLPYYVDMANYPSESADSTTTPEANDTANTGDTEGSADNADAAGEGTGEGDAAGAEGTEGTENQPTENAGQSAEGGSTNAQQPAEAA